MLVHFFASALEMEKLSSALTKIVFNCNLRNLLTLDEFKVFSDFADSVNCVYLNYLNSKEVNKNV